MSVLNFNWTPLGIVLSTLLIAATAVLCWVSWRRSGYDRRTGLLEMLRFVAMAMIAVSLNQPEWLEQYEPTQQPTLLVLADTSRSMRTRDVLESDQASGSPRTRSEAIEPLLDQDLWQPAAREMRVVIEKFSSAPPEGEEGTDLGGALLSGSRRYDNLQAIVVLSDGDWNVGEPPAIAAGQLRVRNIPVFPLGVGSPSRLPDVELARVDAPTFGVLGKPLRIPIVIESALPQDYMTTIKLTASSGEEVTRQVTIPAMDTLEDVLIWKPQELGEFKLTVDVPVHDNEISDENNQRVVPISIREETIKVLLVESVPRWEYRYLRNALERDPSVEVDGLLFHPGLAKVGGGKNYLEAFPSTIDELTKYDVIFLGDVGVEPGQLTAEQCELIQGLIKNQAGGLILMPGLRGAHLTLAGTALEELYPVVLDASQPRGWGSRTPARMELTESGRRSLLTKLEDDEEANAALWASLPGFYWYAPVLRTKAGTEVLARHKSEANEFGRLPLLVTKTYGTGKILFMGTDHAWRWREGVEDLYHYRFWGQVARWMAYQRGMASGERMRLFYSPDRPQRGDVVTLNANVMNSSGEPLQAGHVLVQITAPSGKVESVRLTPTGDWGLYTNSFEAEEEGNYELKLISREDGTSLSTRLAVQGVSRERLGRPARFDVLEELAATTGGRAFEATDPSGFKQILADLVALDEPEPLVRRLRIWCHPAWAGMLVLVLGSFWLGRKMVGTV